MSRARARGSDRPLVVDPATSERLGRVRQKGTAAEQAVAAMLRELGVRAGKPRRRLPGSPDFVNLTQGWAIFVHGCFWHAHTGCKRATVPKRNRAFWLQKFADNRRRDARVLREVRALRLRSLVIWECELGDGSRGTRRRLVAFLSGRTKDGATSPRRHGSLPKMDGPRSRDTYPMVASVRREVYK